MGNLITLMCFGALILFALISFASMAGLRRRNNNSPLGGLGNESPRFDDPFIQSGGSFGGSRGGGNVISGSGVPLGGDRPRHNDPNVKSGGSFGG